MPLTPRCTRAAPDRALSLAGTQSRRVPFEAAAQYDAIDTYAGDVGPLDHERPAVAPRAIAAITAGALMPVRS